MSNFSRPYPTALTSGMKIGSSPSPRAVYFHLRTSRKSLPLPWRCSGRCQSGRHRMQYHSRRDHVRKHRLVMESVAEVALRGRSVSKPAKCYICGDLYESDRELDQHLECRHAADLIPYRCPSCAQDRCLPIRSMRAINKHFALHDVQERQHQCDYCALRFRTVRNLQSHVRLYHRGGERNVIGGDSETQLSTDQHSPVAGITESRRSRFQCCHCGATFTSGNALKRHENTHTLSVRYACEQCGKEFAKMDCLTQHVRIHTQSRPYACEQCPKAFIQLAHLRIHHRARHSGERTHWCAVCNRGFRCRTGLIVHGRIHTGEKPFRCTICEVPFSDAGTLRKHGAVHQRKGGRRGREGVTKG